MDEEISDVDEDLSHSGETAHVSEFSPIETSDEEAIEPMEETELGDNEIGVESQSTLAAFDFITDVDAYISHPDEEGIFVWEGEAYEDSEYGGDEFDNPKDEQPLLPVHSREHSKTPSIPKVATSASGITASSRSRALKSKSSSSKSNIHVSTSTRKRTGGPPNKPCGRERMRRWLNRDRTSEHNRESFLGIPYSSREALLDKDDPCRSLYFGEEKPPAKSTENGSADKKRRHLCACKVAIWEPFKSAEGAKHKLKEHVSGRDLATHSVAFKLPEASPDDDADSNRAVCKCGQNTSDTASSGHVRGALTKIGSSRIYELGRAEVLKKLGICTCGKGDPGGSRANARLKKKIHKLVIKMLEARRCHCSRTGWMSSRKWPKKKQKCICKHLKRMQREFQAAINELWQREKEYRAEVELEKMREQKIELLYKAIGPQLAAEYRQLAAKAKTEVKMKKNRFVKKILEEFGVQMLKYWKQSMEDGSAFAYYDTNDYSSFQYVELPGGSIYYGQFSPLGMEGRCIYKMSHGPIFVGSMVDGKMEGPGRLIYPNGGRVDGIWVTGALFDPRYTFADGLKFEPTGWQYCRMPDRRFVSEIIKGMNSPDNVQLCANHPARQIPKGCLDAGEGFYDPQKKIIIHPSTGKTVRIVNEHEGQWILKNCRREWFEEVPFSRHMYENWYAGTVFTPPLDEADWFNEEFPKVLLPYSNVDDVIEARKAAAMEAERLLGPTEDPPTNACT